MTREKFNRMNKAAVRWEETVAGMEALAEEYEASGWRTLVLHPGDVATTPGGTAERDVGFRLVVPESELDALAELVDEDDAYDEFEVHRAPEGNLLVFVVVVKSPERRRAVVFPVYYDPEVDSQFVEKLDEQETIYTSITTLGESQVFSFSHEKPSLFRQ